MQKLLTFLPLLLSAAALAVAVVGRSPPPPPEPEAVARPAPPPAQAPRAAESDASDKLASLEATTSNLVRRVAELERAAASRAEVPGQPIAPADRQQLSALRTDVDALLTGEALGTDGGKQKLKEMVRSIQDEVFAERVERRSAAREQARTERMKRFAEEAHLSPTQELDLTKLLDEEAKKRRALLDAARTGDGARQETFAELRTLREKTDEDAKRLLGADQLPKYEELRKEDRRGERGGGGGGGAGAAGGGGRAPR